MGAFGESKGALASVDGQCRAVVDMMERFLAVLASVDVSSLFLCWVYSHTFAP